MSDDLDATAMFQAEDARRQRTDVRPQRVTGGRFLFHAWHVVLAVQFLAELFH